MASDSMNFAGRGSGPEPTKYDKARHEEMRLRPNGMYGIPKFFVQGFAPNRWCDCGCDRLKVWCPRNEKSK
jgi:hypothetical protein